MRFLSLLFLLVFLAQSACSPEKNKSQNTEQDTPNADAIYIRNNYQRKVFRIPMRDGAKLYTVVYQPKDKTGKYPIMLRRSPYNVGRKSDKLPDKLGPSKLFARQGYIFVYQDVRGKFMSEGKFVNMRPMIPGKNQAQQIDESTDTYDTIEWLLANLDNHNGKVGMEGISYPGFYAAAALVESHPALKAVSPQAPIADWFFDDFHHHGAFFLPHFFNFFAVFGQKRDSLTTLWPPGFEHGTPDGYQFFMDLGPLKNVNRKYYRNQIEFWNQVIEHPNYDDFWQKRNLIPHLTNVKPAVLVVGGLFDAEDLYGPQKIYQQIEKHSPQTDNFLVLGPWQHGGWARTDGTHLGHVFFTDKPKPSEFYQKNIELPFFNHYLKGEKKPDIAEATVFCTGSNRWYEFEKWYPDEVEHKKLFLRSQGRLSPQAPKTPEAFDEYISDPAKPVPHSPVISTGMRPEYMTEDQRFAARRPDVLVYQTPVLKRDITFVGNLIADLKVSTSQTAADWVVKLIDVYPPDHPGFEHNPPEVKMGGYQQMVRSEIFRGRFRNSYQKPEPFVPNQVAQVRFELLDLMHTFKKGHKIMVQIQSSWFPMVDRNPQRYVENIYTDATQDDFVQATHRVHRSRENPSFIEFRVLK